MADMRPEDREELEQRIARLEAQLGAVQGGMAVGLVGIGGCVVAWWGGGGAVAWPLERV